MVCELVPGADLLEVLLAIFLEEFDECEGGDEALVVDAFFVALGETEHAEVLDEDGVGLLASGSLVCDGVEGAADGVDGHAHLAGVVDAHPPEPHRLQPALQLDVHRQHLAHLVMHQRHPQLRTVIVLPQVLAKTLQCLLRCLQRTLYRQDYDLALRGVLVHRQHDVLACLHTLEHSQLLVAQKLYSGQKGKGEGRGGKERGEVVREVAVLQLYLLPLLDGGSEALGRERLIVMPSGWRFHVLLVLLDHGRALALLLLAALLLEQQHFAQSDAFDDALGDHAHLLALKGVVEEEHVRLALPVEHVHLAQL